VVLDTSAERVSATVRSTFEISLEIEWNIVGTTKIEHISGPSLTALFGCN